jgi:hypothetical protein
MLFRYEQYSPITTTITNVNRITSKFSNWLYGAYVTRHTQWERHCTLYIRRYKTQVSVGNTKWKKSLLFRMHNTNPLDRLSRGIWRSFHCGEAEDTFNTHFQLLYASWHTLVKCVLREAAKTKKEDAGTWTTSIFRHDPDAGRGGGMLQHTNCCYLGMLHQSCYVSLFRAVPLRNSTA